MFYEVIIMAILMFMVGCFAGKMIGWTLGYNKGTEDSTECRSTKTQQRRKVK